MKTFRNIAALALVALVAAFPTRAIAWDREMNYETPRADGHTIVRSGVTGESIAMRIKRKTGGGVADGPSLTIEASGDLTFQSAGTSNTADTTIGLPTKNGTIDVSDATADTWGEVCDGINDSTGDIYECTLVDVLPSDSSNNILLALAESTDSTGAAASQLTTAVRGTLFGEEGMALCIELANVDEYGISIGPEYLSDDRLAVQQDSLLNRRADPTDSRAKNWRVELNYALANATFSAGSSQWQIYAVQGYGAGAIEELLYTKVGAATTVDSTVDFTDLPPIRLPSGWRLVIKYDIYSTPTATACTFQVNGLMWSEGTGPTTP